ncbi:MAG: 5-oxoprolinase subunit PxpB [Caldimonas sp.]
MGVRVLDAGDAAFTVEFGDRIDPALLAAVTALDRAIAREQAAGRMTGLLETMPTFRSLTLFFDPLVTDRAALIDVLRPLLDGDGHASPVAGRGWQLPVCYEGDAGPDLADTARAIGATVDELVALHSEAEYRVHMLGFLPGFPFMGGVPERLHLPRRSQPRVRVPSGSVAIAGELAAIYPWESPGGWHLLGRCPIPLFDAAREAPALLGVSDRVRFVPISTSEYNRLEQGLRAGEIDPTNYLTDLPSAADTA